MSSPEQLKYSATHQWARRESDGTVSVGITDHAQEMLGDVVFIDSPKAGSRVKQGEVCGVIESVKAASDIYAPLSGEIIAVNAELGDAPEKVNADPYAAWMFRVKPANAAELDALLDAAAYRKIADAEKA
ncbi:MAG: glycine cleavage system protein GcvH [Burkholderiales bacterium]|nr:glycine cleavage system protein GcvH [Burkholderiales bacterium]